MTVKLEYNCKGPSWKMRSFKKKFFKCKTKCSKSTKHLARSQGRIQSLMVLFTLSLDKVLMGATTEEPLR